MWDLPRPGIESVSPALAGGFFTTGPPGGRCVQDFMWTYVFVSYILRIRIRIFLRKKKNILRIAVSRGCKEEDYFEEFTCLNT